MKQSYSVDDFSLVALSLLTNTVPASDPLFSYMRDDFISTNVLFMCYRVVCRSCDYVLSTYTNQ